MRKIFTITTICFLSGISLFGQNRLVFIEEFTQASCPPCEASTPQLNATLIANADKVVQLRYQTSWPGADPMNADNPGEVATRVSYYGVDGVPALRIDGSTATGATFPVLVTAANINSNYAVPAAVDFALTHDLSEDNSQIILSVAVTNNGADAYNVATNRLRIAIAEEEINWPYTPGSTSIKDYEYVMKSFVTGVQGMALPEIAAGETWEMEWTVDVPSTTYSYKELAVVGFIQNDANRSIVNSAVSNHVELNGDYFDMAAENATPDVGFCGDDFVPKLLVQNEGTVAITSGMIEASLNGTVFYSEPWTGEIAGGAVEEVEFDAIPQIGRQSVDLQFTNANEGAFDYDRFNGVSEVKDLNSFSEFDGMDVGFEGLSFLDESEFIVVDRPFRDVFATVTPAAFQITTPVGAFGQSENCTFVRFYEWNDAGAKASMYYGEFDISAMSSPKLSFDRVYRQYQTSNDGLEFFVSDDCGDTWTSVWQAQGSALSTMSPSTDELFLTVPVTWESAEADLTAFAGSTNLSVRVEATSDYGNSLFLDNIAVSGVVSNNEIVNNDLAAIFPNPVNDRATIQLNMESASDVILEVSDLSGQRVASRNYGLQAANAQITFDVNDFSNGMYIFKIISGDVVSSQKISVMK